MISQCKNAIWCISIVSLTGISDGDIIKIQQIYLLHLHLYLFYINNNEFSLNMLIPMIWVMWTSCHEKIGLWIRWCENANMENFGWELGWWEHALMIISAEGKGWWEWLPNNAQSTWRVIRLCGHLGRGSCTLPICKLNDD